MCPTCGRSTCLTYSTTARCVKVVPPRCPQYVVLIVSPTSFTGLFSMSLRNLFLFAVSPSINLRFAENIGKKFLRLIQCRGLVLTPKSAGNMRRYPTTPRTYHVHTARVCVHLGGHALVHTQRDHRRFADSRSWTRPTRASRPSPPLRCA